MALVEQVMFPGNVECLGAEAGKDLLGVVEFGVLRQVGDVTGVDDEVWLDGQGLDLLDRLEGRAARVGVGRLIETDVRVADLHEGEGLGGLVLRS